MNREARFLERVDSGGPDGCWLWLGSRFRTGYGRAIVARKGVLAHRLSHELFVGVIPDGAVVLHLCDRQICVNPEHLRAGTQKENLDDMVAKGRDRRVGDENGRSKLTGSQVAEIVDGLREGRSQRSLARQFSVSKFAIHRIANGTGWAHVSRSVTRGTA